jgi:hypothetical protein
MIREHAPRASVRPALDASPYPIEQAAEGRCIGKEDSYPQCQLEKSKLPVQGHRSWRELPFQAIRRVMNSRRLVHSFFRCYFFEEDFAFYLSSFPNPWHQKPVLADTVRLPVRHSNDPI